MNHRRVFTLIALAASIGACGPSSGRPEHGVGYKYVPEHHKAFSFLGGGGGGGVIQRLAPDDTTTMPTVPTSVDNSQWNPPIGDQGEIGSCAAWSTGYSVGGYLSNQGGSGLQLFAPMDVYDQASAGCIDCGMELIQAFGFTQHGLLPAAAYDAVVPTFVNYTASIPTLGVDAAANDLIGGEPGLPAPTQGLASYQQIFDATPSATPCAGAAGASAAIQVAISQAYPVVIAIPVFPEFDNYNGVTPVAAPTADEQSRGGHAIMCSKFDANGLWCQNQWGATWGAAGWVQLSWGFVDQCTYEADLGTALVPTASMAPLPTINSPATGSTLSGSVTFDVSIPAQVQYAWIAQVNSGLIGMLSPGSGTDYTMLLDTTSLPNTSGWIALIAQTEDANGNLAQSTPIEVQISNLAPANPVPVILTPTPGTTVTEPIAVSGSILVPPQWQQGPLETITPCTSVSIQLDGVALGNAMLHSAGNDTATQAYYPQTYTYSFDPSPFTSGSHALSAMCVDAGGQLHASTPVAITIGAGIAVLITAPAAGSTVAGVVGVSVTVANVLSPGGTIALYVDAYAAAVGTTPVTTTGTVTPSFSWDTTDLFNASNTLTAVYTDSSGTRYSSAPVPVTVANAEAIITSPASGAVVYGSVTITTTTTPSCETLDIYLDGVPIVPNLSCSGATISSNWITSNFGDGPHVLTAQYYDGLTFGTSPPVQVIVQNNRTAAAQIDITSPTTNATVATEATIVATVAPGTTTVGFYLDSYYTPVPTSDGSATTGLAVPPGATTMQVTWDASQTTDGNHVLLAESYDAMGNYWLSPVVYVVVENPQLGPAVSFGPLASTTVSGLVYLQVFAAPGTAPLASCYLWSNTTIFEQYLNVPAFANGYFWGYIHTNTFPNGPLSVYAKCTDTAGASNYALLNLTVAN